MFFLNFIVAFFPLRILQTFHEIHTKDSDAIVCGSKLINDRFKELPIPVFYANISFDEKIWPVHEVKKNISSTHKTDDKNSYNANSKT